MIAAIQFEPKNYATIVEKITEPKSHFWQKRWYLIVEEGSGKCYLESLFCWQIFSRRVFRYSAPNKEQVMSYLRNNKIIIGYSFQGSFRRFVKDVLKAKIEEIKQTKLNIKVPLDNGVLFFPKVVLNNCHLITSKNKEELSALGEQAISVPAAETWLGSIKISAQGEVKTPATLKEFEIFLKWYSFVFYFITAELTIQLESSLVKGEVRYIKLDNKTLTFNVRNEKLVSASAGSQHTSQLEGSNNEWINWYFVNFLPYLSEMRKNLQQFTANDSLGFEQLFSSSAISLLLKMGVQQSVEEARSALVIWNKKTGIAGTMKGKINVLKQRLYGLEEVKPTIGESGLIVSYPTLNKDDQSEFIIDPEKGMLFHQVEYYNDGDPVVYKSYYTFIDEPSRYDFEKGIAKNSNQIVTINLPLKTSSKASSR